VPKLRRHSKISPIPKSNSSKLGPIALATCIRKLVDTILTKRFDNWLEENNILPNNFFGVRAGHSTIDAVSQLVLDIHQSFINKERLVAVFSDIENAYPSVHLPTLFNILSEIGLPDHFTQYISVSNQKISTLLVQLYLHPRSVYPGPSSGLYTFPNSILYNIVYILFPTPLE